MFSIDIETCAVCGGAMRIVGVHSRAEGKPMKVANFAPRDESFADAASYRDWVFAYAPQGGGGAAKAAVPAPAGGALPSAAAPPFGAAPAAAAPPFGAPGAEPLPR